MATFNNAGGGNCGYYAMSLGLIDIIQKELRQGKVENTTLSKLVPYLPPHCSEEQFKTFKFATYEKNFRNYNDFLNDLQNSLRNIAVMGLTDPLKSAVQRENQQPSANLTLVESTELFNQFNEIVLAKSNNQKIDEKFNDLVHSPKVRKLADAVVKSFNDHPTWKQLNGHAKDEQLKKLGKAVVKDHLQVILNASEKILENGYWAKHCHLKTIAEVLDVNLTVTGNVNNGANKPDSPSITLNNHSNAHWTTSIDNPLGYTPLVKKPKSPSSDTTTTLKKTLSPQEREQQVINTLLEKSPDKDQGKYKAHLEELLLKAKEPGFFDKKNDGSDEDIAKGLQEKEFKDAGLKP